MEVKERELLKAKAKVNTGLSNIYLIMDAKNVSIKKGDTRKLLNAIYDINDIVSKLKIGG